MRRGPIKLTMQRWNHGGRCLKICSVRAAPQPLPLHPPRLLHHLSALGAGPPKETKHSDSATRAASNMLDQEAEETPMLSFFLDSLKGHFEAPFFPLRRFYM